MTTATTKNVTDLRMPIASHGSRSGFATATVDGVPKRLHTSRSDRTDYYEHESEVRDRFAAGEGETVPRSVGAMSTPDLETLLAEIADERDDSEIRLAQAIRQELTERAENHNWEMPA